MAEDLELFDLLCRDLAERFANPSGVISKARLLSNDYTAHMLCGKSEVNHPFVDISSVRTAREESLRYRMLSFLNEVLSPEAGEFDDHTT